MARYYPVSPLFWSDAKVRQWDDRTTLLALYLLTCEHRNLEGLYRLPLAYVEADLCWPADAVLSRMGGLCADGFIDYDHSGQVVFVRNALKYQAPKSKLQIKGAINALEQVPETPLMEQLAETAAVHSRPLATAIRRAFATHSNGTG